MILILTGLPASGKTTYAMEWLAEAPRRARINYDDLRIEMFGKHWRWNAKDEKAMKAEALRQARHLLNDGFSVIIDNTNLNERARQPWIDLAVSLLVPYEIHEIDTPVAECVARDRLRSGTARVGRAVIERMALFNGWIDWSDSSLYPRDFIIVDMDGTVADCDWRRKLAFGGPTVHKLIGPPRTHLSVGEMCPDAARFVDRECPTCGGKAKRNWPLFAANVERDPVIAPIRDLVRYLNERFDVIIVSGREIGPSGKGTEEWIENEFYNKLETGAVKVKHLFMRASQDYRADDIIKQEILDLLPKERIKYVLDDRERVVQMWRRNGLTCLQVADGEF